MKEKEYFENKKNNSRWFMNENDFSTINNTDLEFEMHC